MNRESRALPVIKSGVLCDETNWNALSKATRYREYTDHLSTSN